MPAYVPDKGDFITLSFDPQSGYEQKGRRPALVVSNFLFNKGTGLAIVCPITNTNRNIPFHLPVPSSSSLTGFVMVEQK
jgi:mRNA interferase MazF